MTSRERSASGDEMSTAMRTRSGPAGTSGSRPRIPRSLEALSTVTTRDDSAMPSMAACMAISVALQLASAPRRSQPADPALLSPPTPTKRVSIPHLKGSSPKSFLGTGQ